MTEGTASETALDVAARPTPLVRSIPAAEVRPQRHPSATRSWRTVAPFVFGLCSFAALAVFDQTRGLELWRNYALSGVLLGSPVTWVLWYYDVRVPHYIQWVIVIGILLHYGGGSLASVDPYHMGLLGMHGVNGAYHQFDWWDHLTHGVGIGTGAMAVAYLLEVYQTRRGLAWSPAFIFFIAVLSGLAAGVAVELYEYLGKSAFQTIDQGGYENTMSDLKYNLYGTLVGAALAVVVDRRRFASRIKSHWNASSTTLEHRPWSERLPSAMAGYIAFVSVPAIGSLALLVNFARTGAPDDDLAHYDPTLQILLQCAIAGALAGPIVAAVARRLLRTPKREAA